MSFRVWLEGIEEYEPFRSKVNQFTHWRSFPFRQWFPANERVYLPFSIPVVESEAYKDIENTLGDGNTPYRITDWKMGFCQKDGSKRVYKISKVLVEKETEELSRIYAGFTNGNISEVKYKSEVASTKRYFKNLTIAFQNDPLRVKQDNFYVCISCNPHDIASMSTGRGWTSCMTLGTGSHHKDVYKELKNGGFVAYLIRSNDMEIKSPIARLHIRRFDNKLGNSVAVPEETIYGQEVPGFFEKVDEWIKTKQGSLSGKFKRMGGQWSDTFSTDSRMKIFGPNNDKMIRKWIDKWIADGQKSSQIEYFKKAVLTLLKSQTIWSKDYLKRIHDVLWNYADKHELSAYKTGILGIMLQFALKYPEFISKEEFKDLIASHVTGNKALYRIFPQYLDAEILDKADKYDRDEIIKANPGLSDVNRDLVRARFEKFDVNNPEFNINDNGRSMWGISGIITDELDLLSIFKPIPESIVRKVVNFVSNIDKVKFLGRDDLKPLPGSVEEKKELYDLNKVRNSIIGHAIHIFAMTDTDSPSVQRFYESMLPRWRELGGIGIFGWAIARLGENGRQFLPFIKQKMEEMKNATLESPIYSKNALEQDREETLEAFRYVIDCLENGKQHSAKYEFSSNWMLDAREKYPR